MRRRWQFGLGTLFVLMLVSSFLLSRPAARRQFVRWGWLPNTRELLNPIYEFEGRKYAGLLDRSGQPPRNCPPGLVLAFVLDGLNLELIDPAFQDEDIRFMDDAPIVVLETDRQTGLPIQVTSIEGQDGRLADVTGDGVLELITGECLPLGQSFTPALRSDYADGSRRVISDGIVLHGDSQVRIYSLTPRVEKLFQVTPERFDFDRPIGYAYAWGDVFETGVQVLSEIELPQHRADLQPERLVRYWHPDDAGNWGPHECDVDLPLGNDEDRQDRLKGVLVP